MQPIIAADDRKVGLARLRGDDEDERYYRSYKQWAKKNGPTRGRLGSRRSLQAPRDWSYYPPEAHGLFPQVADTVAVVSVAQPSGDEFDFPLPGPIVKSALQVASVVDRIGIKEDASQSRVRILVQKADYGLDESGGDVTYP